jgi:signal transduction histidine kinase
LKHNGGGAQKALAVLGFLVWIASGVCGPAETAPEPRPTPNSVLTNAVQILALPLDEIRSRFPVRIEGTVTFYDSAIGLFVQDATGGIFVYTAGAALQVEPGQRVVVSGFTNRGRYSPIIDSPQVSLLGTAAQTVPRTVSLAEIYVGGLDAQWVLLTGVVRSQKVLGEGLQLELAVPPNRLNVWIPRLQGRRPPRLEGAAVTLRGVVGTQCNEQGQVTGFQIFANSLDDIMAVRSTRDGFSAPTVAIQNLKDPNLRIDGVGRVHIAGTVTLCWPGHALFVQDATGSVELQPRERLGQLVTGSSVEATGFLGPVLQAARLEDAVVRSIGTNEPAQPVPVSAEDLVRGRHGQDLVEVEATFLDWANSVSNSPALALESQGHLFMALLDLPSRHGLHSGLERGSRLRLTGVPWSGATRSGIEPVVSLLLRSPEDIKITARPVAGVTPRGLSMAIAVAALAGAGLLLSLAYGQKKRQQTLHVLQVQANLQTEMRQGEQQLRRAMEEREQIGRDLHDDIIQSIYAVGLNLEDCRRVIRESPQQAEGRVLTAIHTLNNTIRSVRGFLTGLEPKVLNGREFKTALKSLALTSGDSPTPFQIEVDPVAANSLNSAQATQLLHISKEAMSNSLRHAKATSIVVSLDHAPGGVRLEIRDNGEGFNLESIGGAGHGLRNMTTRAREIGAELQIVSAPGQGCRIVVSVPQRNPNERH